MKAQHNIATEELIIRVCSLCNSEGVYEIPYGEGDCLSVCEHCKTIEGGYKYITLYTTNKA